MKTKIIPFDLEMAKKIQAGDIAGKIKTRDGQDVRIILWNKKDEDGYIILTLIDKPGTDLVLSYTCNGEIYKGHKTNIDLVLEVLDNEPQFKPFDKVLVRKPDLIDPHDIYSQNEWVPALFQGMSDSYFIAEHKEWEECIPYEGNEYLVGTTDNSKEIC